MMPELGKANTLLCAKVRVSTNELLICPKSKTNPFPEPCERCKAETGGWRVKKLLFTCRGLSVALEYTAAHRALKICRRLLPERRDLPCTELEPARNMPGFWGGDVKWERLCRGHTLEGQKRRGRGWSCQDGKSASLGCDEFFGGVSSSFTPSLCSPQSAPQSVTFLRYSTTLCSSNRGQLCHLLMKHHPGCWSHTAMPPADLEGNRGKKSEHGVKKVENYCLCANKTVFVSRVGICALWGAEHKIN